MTDDPSLTNLAGSSSAQTSVMTSACISTPQFTFILNQHSTHGSNVRSILLESFNLQVTKWPITHIASTLHTVNAGSVSKHAAISANSCCHPAKGNTTLQRTGKLPIGDHLVSSPTQQVRAQTGFSQSTRSLPAGALTCEQVTGQLPSGSEITR